MCGVLVLASPPLSAARCHRHPAPRRSSFRAHPLVLPCAAVPFSHVDSTKIPLADATVMLREHPWRGKSTASLLGKWYMHALKAAEQNWGLIVYNGRSNRTTAGMKCSNNGLRLSSEQPAHWAAGFADTGEPQAAPAGAAP